MLVSKNPCRPNAKPDRPNAKPGKRNAKPVKAQHEPQCEQVKYRPFGSPGIGGHIGHVGFMLFGSLSLALGSQRKRTFQ